MPDAYMDAFIASLESGDLDPLYFPRLAGLLRELGTALQDARIKALREAEAAIKADAGGGKRSYEYDCGLRVAARIVARLREDAKVERPHPCGDYPAPCNCDDPERHGGH